MQVEYVEFLLGEFVFCSLFEIIKLYSSVIGDIFHLFPKIIIFDIREKLEYETRITEKNGLSLRVSRPALLFR